MSVTDKTIQNITPPPPCNSHVDGNLGNFSEECEDDRNCSVPPQNHPLLNDVILSKVLEHVRPKDLLTCRGVCQKWNLATIPFTRLAFEIRVYGKETIHSTRWSGCYTEVDLNPNLNAHKKVEKFVELFTSNKLGIPFGRFKLGAFPTTNDTIGQKFLRLCGDAIHEISFLDEEFKVEDLSEILKSTPKLQSLGIPGMSSKNNVKLFPDGKASLNHLKKIFITGISDSFCPNFLEEILSVAQNITDVTVGGISDGISIQGDTSLEVLRVFQKLGLIPSIQILSLFHMKSQHMEILTSQPNFELRSLNYFQSGKGVDPIKLIAFFKNTLHVINLSDVSGNSFTEFPKMPYLRHMTLKFNSVLNSRCVNLDKIFPTLEKLHLVGMCNENHDHDVFFPESEPCLTLKAFRFDGIYFKINAFKHIQIIFPNLTELHLHKFYLDTVEHLRHIWGEMTQLEVLILRGVMTGMDELDSVFIGIPTQGIQGITGVVNELEGMTEGLRGETIQNLTHQLSQFPSITNLTRLRRLNLDVIANSEIWSSPTYNTNRTSYLTDLTLYFGLYSMKSLKHLIVQMCGFTKTGCKILTEELELETWGFISMEYQEFPLHPSRASRVSVNEQTRSGMFSIVYNDII